MMLFSCSSDGTEKSSVKSIFLPDGREALLNHRFQNLVGSFQLGAKRCTAFISGKDELTTAAHCYGGESLDKVNFVRGATSINPISIKQIFAKADVIKFTIETENEYLETIAFYPNQSVSLISNDPTGQGLTVDKNCSFAEQQPVVNAIIHKCDTEKRSSGSPILQGGKVVGVHIGSTKNQGINIGVVLSDINNVDLSDLEYNFENWTPQWVKDMDTR